MNRFEAAPAPEEQEVSRGDVIELLKRCHPNSVPSLSNAVTDITRILTSLLPLKDYKQWPRDRFPYKPGQEIFFAGVGFDGVERAPVKKTLQSTPKEFVAALKLFLSTPAGETAAASQETVVEMSDKEIVELVRALTIDSPLEDFFSADRAIRQNMTNWIGSVTHRGYALQKDVAKLAAQSLKRKILAARDDPENTYEKVRTLYDTAIPILNMAKYKLTDRDSRQLRADMEQLIAPFIVAKIHAAKDMATLRDIGDELQYLFSWASGYSKRLDELKKEFNFKARGLAPDMPLVERKMDWTLWE